MADRYSNFAALSRSETSGIDFRILVRRATAAFAVVAPHGGGIEPGTSEIADAIAAEEFSFYAFEGMKSEGNAVLHITSTRFDEPLCLTVIGASENVLTIHGEESDADGQGVFVGGRNTELGGCLGRALEARGFIVKRHPDPQLQGLEKKNLCNRGKLGRGVQLELSQTVREQMFSSLTREGRKHKTPAFEAFVDAVRSELGAASNKAPGN